MASGVLPADVLKDLRFKKGFKSRKDLADHVPGWTEEIIRNLESFNDNGLPRTLFTINHLKDLKAAKIISEGDEWDKRFQTALVVQGKLSLAKQKVASVQPSATGVDTSPNLPTMGVGKGQSVRQEVKMPYETPSDRTRQEVPTGTNPVKPRGTKWLLFVVLILIMGLGGSFIGGVVLMRWYMQRGKPAAQAPSVVTKVVTATLGPATSVPTQQVIIVTATPKPATATLVPSNTPIVPTPTPPPTDIPKPTDTPRPTNTPTATPTVMPLPFEDNFDKGLRPEWRVVSGNWRMVNNKIIADKGDGTILVGDESWGDYSVSVEVEYTWGGSSGSGPSRIIVRADRARFIALELGSWQADFISVSSGDTRVLAKSGGGFRSSEMVRYTVEVKGDIYTAYRGNDKVLQLQDRSLTHGAAGLSMLGPVTFDNFKVAPVQ